MSARQPPLFIDLPFEEALRRYVQTDPAELPPKPKRPPSKKTGRPNKDAPGTGKVDPKRGRERQPR